MPRNLTPPGLVERRDAALALILQRANIHNEAGEALRDFVPQNLDRLDFATVSRWQLQSLMQAAWAAGRGSVR